MRRNTKNRSAHLLVRPPPNGFASPGQLGDPVAASFHRRRLMPLIYLFAGEQSGDVLGAALMHAIRVRRPDATFIGVGGSAMAGQGLTSFFPSAPWR